MEVAKMMKGLQFVKKFFPHAHLPARPSDAAVKALTLLGDLDEPLQSDIVQTFDHCGVGVWGGEGDIIN